MRRIATSFLAAVVLISAPASSRAAEKEKARPYPQYWISVWTQNQSLPGMEAVSGMAGLLGKSAGFGPRRDLHLQVVSPRQLPADPEATHDIPPGQKMGRTLPLIVPPKERPRRFSRQEREEREPEKFEKPKARMLIYWGCGEDVAKGQPLVIDTEKMGPADFGKAFSGRSPSPQYPPSPRSGWVYADWPNEESRIEVPKESSMTGEHFIHGNYIPDIRFSVGGRHDFMAPVEFTSVSGGAEESIRLQWKEIPTAIGYFATAMGHNDGTDETIFWSSSEVKETGFGLMDYLTPSDVRKFIKEKVVMPPSVTGCSIPKGIFREAPGAMLQFIGYGDDLYVEYPPRPKDPRQPYTPQWTVRMRLKSTGMTTLASMDEERGGRSKRRGERREEQAPPDEQGEEQQEEEERPGREPRREREGGTLDKLRGIFGF